MPEFPFPEDWISSFEAPWLANYQEMGAEFWDTYDPETNMNSVTPDGARLGDWVKNARPSWQDEGEKNQYRRYADLVNGIFALLELDKYYRKI